MSGQQSLVASCSSMFDGMAACSKGKNQLGQVATCCSLNLHWLGCSTLRWTTDITSGTSSSKSSCQMCLITALGLHSSLGNRLSTGLYEAAAVVGCMIVPGALTAE
eukprot:GHUV01033364.1.p2 GENE.GHUV01033364.1~~GHUV01033364.1.p2  ORF type:complete len:106 (-),score=36.97 GHUV01033364.1:694-1011(-)